MKQSSPKLPVRKGGAPIAAGGFGCVFYPPIKCKSAQSRKLQKSNMVSKLMLKENAEEEFQEIQRIIPIINKIPHAERYFISAGIFPCKPDNLTSEDLINFNKTCHNIAEGLELPASKINKNLDYFKILNIPYGGPSMNKYWSTIVNKNTASINANKFASVNKSLILLLKNAIIPMNRLGLIHMDIKADNVLCNDGTPSSPHFPICRIIDWGLANVINPEHITSQDIDDTVSRRPIQFNTPYNIVFFHYLTEQLYQDYARKFFNRYKNNKDIESIGYNPFVYNVARELAEHIINEERGHVKYVEKTVLPIIFRCTGMSSDGGKELFQNLLTEGIIKVLNKYGSSSKIDTKKYFSDVFRFNIDIWGFIMIYYDLLRKIDYIKTRRGIMCSRHHTTFTAALAKIITKYCMNSKYATERIPTDKLINDLEKLNKIVGGIPMEVSYAALDSTKKVEPTKKTKSIKKTKYTEQTKPTKKETILIRKTSKRHSRMHEISLGTRKRCPRGYRRYIHPTRKVPICRQKNTLE